MPAEFSAQATTPLKINLGECVRLSAPNGPAVAPEPLPAPPEAAIRVFADELPNAVRYAELLAADGVSHGLIGPREVPVLWSRHLLNSAVVTDLLPAGARVLDVGSGAGLPGIPMALRRPDMRITLLEPKLRRVAFLTEVISELSLAAQVSVVRGRTDDPAVVAAVRGQEWIVARAVAPLARLVGWCVPLLAPRGRLLALKGMSAIDEVERDRDAIVRESGSTPTVVELGGVEEDRTWVVSVQRQAAQLRRTRRI